MDDAPWECLACTYVNMPGDPACEMCGTPHDAPQIATELPPDDPFQPVIASCNAVRAMWASDNKLDYKNTGDAAAGCALHAGHKEARAFMFKFAPHIGDIFSVQVRQGTGSGGRHRQGVGGSGLMGGVVPPASRRRSRRLPAAGGWQWQPACAFADRAHRWPAAVRSRDTFVCGGSTTMTILLLIMLLLLLVLLLLCRRTPTLPRRDTSQRRMTERCASMPPSATPRLRLRLRLPLRPRLQLAPALTPRHRHHHQRQLQHQRQRQQQRRRRRRQWTCPWRACVLR